jgi:hypothetical protein
LRSETREAELLIEKLRISHIPAYRKRLRPLGGSDQTVQLCLVLLTIGSMEDSFGEGLAPEKQGR